MRTPRAIARLSRGARGARAHRGAGLALTLAALRRRRRRAALKLQAVERAHAEKHYEDLSSKPFFAGLVEYSARPCTRAAHAMQTLRSGGWGQLTLPSSLSPPLPVCSGPVVAMVWEGKDVVKQGRAMIGATNPLASAPGTIRGDYCIEARPCL